LNPPFLPDPETLRMESLARSFPGSAAQPSGESFLHNPGWQTPFEGWVSLCSFRSELFQIPVVSFKLIHLMSPNCPLLEHGAKKSPGLPGDTYVDFRLISIRFQQKHSRLLAKEVIKIKPVCICDCHVSKLMIPFKEKNYCHIFFDHFAQIQNSI
jgi:hypothetical protein